MGLAPPAGIAPALAVRGLELCRWRLRRARVANASSICIEVVRKSDNQVDFAVIARRWVVERFFVWINRNRRLTKDFEASIQSVEAFPYAASSVIMLRRLAC